MPTVHARLWRCQRRFLACLPACLPACLLVCFFSCISLCVWPGCVLLCSLVFVCCCVCVLFVCVWGGSPPYQNQKSDDSIRGKESKSSCRMMIVHFNQKGGGGGHQRGTGDAEDAGSQGQKQAKARKPPKATKPKSHLPQRNWQCRGCEMPKPQKSAEPTKTNREEV